jgi:adenylate kinase family enzyme
MISRYIHLFIRGLNAGVDIVKIMMEGQLIQSNILLYLLEKTMIQLKESRGFIIDGFPMSIEQLETFEILVGRISLVLHLNASFEVALGRDPKLRCNEFYTDALEMIRSYSQKDSRFVSVCYIILIS